MAQVEVTGWGSLRGMRVGDELIALDGAVGIETPDRRQIILSQREGPTRTTQFVRDGAEVTVGITLQYTPPASRWWRSTIDPGTVSYSITYRDSAPGVCDVYVQITSATTQPIGEIRYLLTLPQSYAEATAFYADSVGLNRVSIPDADGRLFAATTRRMRIERSGGEWIELSTASATRLAIERLRHDDRTVLQLSLTLHDANLPAGHSVEKSFTIKAAHEPDTAPVRITLNPAMVGRQFDGIGGNYRIQDARLDPLHIQYIFDHMRVAYGRVAMPWNNWQPRMDDEPPMLSGAPAPPGSDGAMGSVPLAMEMAQALARRNIPMIISVWSPPPWATLRQNSNERGVHLDPSKWDAICESIGSYLLHLRDNLGVEPRFFSFNEPDAGIDVRQTPQEHCEAIKRLGAHFKAMNLKTRMLLGDTAEVPPIEFIAPALNDPQARRYIGAIAFHSWRGATDEQYQRWADAAALLGVPLINAEGGNDAQAHGYTNLLREPWYALDEVAEYVRILRICQPQTILQWQLTENYSVLRSDAAGALHPTQRFFNLKQINLTVPGSSWVDVRSSSALVHPAAFIHQNSGVLSLHVVNDGAARELTISGLPRRVSKLRMYVTDEARSMEEAPAVAVSAESARLIVPARAFTTFITQAD